MPGVKFSFKSIVSKLMLLNFIILVAFGGVILINYSLSRQTRNLVIAFVDQGVNRTIANERLSRSLSKLSTDLQLLISTFTIERERLAGESERLLREKSEIIHSALGDEELSAPLDRFSSAFDALLSGCQTVDRSVTRIEQSKEALNGMFQRIETAVVDSIITVKLTGREYEITSLEQSAALLPDLRYLLLKIDLALAESQRAHLKRQKPAVDYESQIVSTIGEMTSAIATMTTAGDRLAPHGQEAMKAVALLQEQIVELHQSMRNLQADLTTLAQSQTQVTRHIADTGKRISGATVRMREEVVANIQSYGSIVGGLSVLVIAVMIAVAFYAFRIARPIQRLTQSVAAIASGQLDEEIKPEGHDEVAILSRSFKQMRDSIREKLQDLAEKNAAMAREMKLREETEAMLRRSEKKYRTLLENIPQKIFYKDTNSIYQSCNRNFSLDAGLEPDQIVGKNDYELYPRELAEKYTADDKRILQSGQTEEIEEPYVQDGQSFIVNTVKTPVIDQDGETIGILGIFWDITEKKRIEQELRKYEQIIATSKDLMSIVDPEYVYQAVSDAYTTAFGTDRGNIVGRSMAEFTGEAVFATVIRPRFERCMGGETVSFQEWITYPVTGRRYMDILFSPFFDETGQVTGVVINARDATRAKQLEDKLNQAQKMEAIGTLAGGIAHDFNNILGAIIGYTELMHLEATDKSEAKEWLEHVLAAAGRAKSLVNQILTFSRQSEQKIRPVKLAPIVEEAVAMIRASIPTTIEIRKEIEKTSGSLMADPTQVHQVLVNLCTNAAHAMKETGGTLTVRLDDVTTSPPLLTTYPDLKAGHYFRIVVADTGHGISQENLGRIFEPYFTTKEKGVGTGLGLATVHGIIESFNGNVEVSSELGGGTTFTVFLPKIDTAGAPDESSPKRTLATGKGHVLLVDDEEALLRVGRHMLSRMGYSADTMTSAVEALELFKADPQRYDVVITDQTMPKMTGQEIAQQMLAIRPDLPIVLCTGFSDLITEEKAISMGIRGYLKKPITLHDFSEAIQKCTASSLPPRGEAEH